MTLEQIAWAGFVVILVAFSIGLLWLVIQLVIHQRAIATQHQTNEPSWKDWFWWAFIGTLSRWVFVQWIPEYLIRSGIPPSQAYVISIGSGLFILIVLVVLHQIQTQQPSNPPPPYSSGRSPLPDEPDLGPPLPPLPPAHAREREYEYVEVRPFVDVAAKTRLRQILNGDNALADRLVHNMRIHHPHQPELWLWEKVISDLERDRR